MLRELRIRNFAVIESATVELAPGLNVLTGETGAGKSMLIDAILLVRGARAQLDVIRTDADSATVEARFEVAPGSPAAAALDEAGLAADGGEILVRRAPARGRGRGASRRAAARATRRAFRERDRRDRGAPRRGRAIRRRACRPRAPRGRGPRAPRRRVLHGRRPAGVGGRAHRGRAH